MKVRDYLRSLEAHLWVEGSDTRVRVSGLDIVIRSLPSEDIRLLLNEAVAHMVVRLNKNLTGSKLKFEQRILELLSLQIALHNLYVFTNWSRLLPRYLQYAGPLRAQELLQHHVPEQVMRFCEKHYAAECRQRAAALLGYSAHELARWEQQRLPSRMCTNNSRYRAS
ncbi:hypothetical protein JVX91_09440 [Pseudomonas sp. PDNC002]|uniref:hypothetical protein n=1 Tax=Pseudomonas sp. PDNC002 TaxID=2811422 RepID=UPI001965FF57|nr:hypothetical protein [Pseudomonas sp. PDNC002]QRY81304.1 hypothetical protein JVX91_09440 [Pseudomonas sp. PDNC002]